MANHKKKFRIGIGIGGKEYSDAGQYMRMNLQTELLMSDGYIGYFDTWTGDLRIFCFDNDEDARKVLREAKRIGFVTAGGIDGPIWVSNADLQRPHLRNIKNHYTFIKELYR